MANARISLFVLCSLVLFHMVLWLFLELVFMSFRCVNVLDGSSVVCWVQAFLWTGYNCFYFSLLLSSFPSALEFRGWILLIHKFIDFL